MSGCGNLTRIWLLVQHKTLLQYRQSTARDWEPLPWWGSSNVQCLTGNGHYSVWEDWRNDYFSLPFTLISKIESIFNQHGYIVKSHIDWGLLVLCCRLMFGWWYLQGLFKLANPLHHTSSRSVVCSSPGTPFHSSGVLSALPWSFHAGM